MSVPPRDIDLLSDATIFLASLGRTQQSLELGQRAVARDPEDPRAHFALGMAYFVDERWEESIHVFQTAVTLSPGFLWAQHFIGAALLFQGHPEAALAAFQEEADPEYRAKGVTLALHALGRRAEFEQSFARLRDDWGAEWPSEIAQVYALDGDPDRAFAWLERAAAQDEADLLQQVSQVFYRPLHDDPRWLSFLRKIGYAPEQLAAIPFDVKVPQQ